MKAEWVNPFYQSFQNVFKIMLDLEVTRQSAAAQSAGSTRKIDVAVPIIGDLSGSVIFQFPEDMTFKMIEIMSGMETHTVDGFVTSALGEMSNIITGNATTQLEAANVYCDILPPEVKIGELPGSLPDHAQTLLLPVHSEIGDVIIHLDLHE